MDFTSPLNGLMRPLDAAIVSALARTEEGLTGRRIESVIRSNSRSGLASSLERLQAVGLVLRADIGNSAVYRVNRQHVFWEGIHDRILAAPAIVELELARFFERRYEDDITVGVFGSVARRTSSLDSDLDVVVVSHAETVPDRATWDSHLVRAAELVKLISGTNAQIVDLDLAGLKAMVHSSDPLIESWYDEARTIYGTDLRVLIRDVQET